MASAPAWLVTPVARILAEPGVTEADRLAAIGALGAIRTRDSMRVLLEQAKVDPLRSGKVRTAVMGALARLSGRAEFGEDLNRWQLWYGQVQWLPEAEWRRELAEGLAGRADGLARERDQAVARLIESLRQQYIQIETVDDRSGQLVRLLRLSFYHLHCPLRSSYFVLQRN